MASDASLELKVTHCAEGLLMATVGPICVALWQTKPTRALFEVQRSQLHAAVTRAPGQVAFLCVVEATAEPPDDAERAASAAMITSQGARLLGVACVIEGSGFRAAITRTVLSGMVLMIRTPAPIKLFDGVRVASPFLARCVRRPLLSELVAQVERGRSMLSDGPAALRRSS